MLNAIQRWLQVKWLPRVDQSVIDAFGVTFSTAHGRIVLQYLLDNCYCTIYEGKDPVELAMHEGQRFVVHLILEHIDKAERPSKYAMFMTAEGATPDGLAR